MHGMGFNPEKKFPQVFPKSMLFAIYGCLEVILNER